MALVNEHFLKLSNNYLFADIAKKVNAYKVSHPKTEVISLGIGDVTQPLCPAVIDAMHKAVDEMAEKATFRGYGPERGYDFLREAISEYYKNSIGADVPPDEILISDGAKSDCGNIVDMIRGLSDQRKILLLQGSHSFSAFPNKRLQNCLRAERKRRLQQLLDLSNALCRFRITLF